MKKICKNCKFYTPPPIEHRDIDNGKCKCKKFVYDDWSGTIYPLNDKLEYFDYDGYRAGFSVGENFGCIHFKKKRED